MVRFKRVCAGEEEAESEKNSQSHKPSFFEESSFRGGRSCAGAAIQGPITFEEDRRKSFRVGFLRFQQSGTPRIAAGRSRRESLKSWPRWGHRRGRAHSLGLPWFRGS